MAVASSTEFATCPSLGVLMSVADRVAWGTFQWGSHIHYGTLPNISCWQGQEFRSFKLLSLVGLPALPDASSVLEFPLCGLPDLSVGLSEIFCGSQSSLLVGWQSPLSSTFFLPAVTYVLRLIHVSCAECCAIDYTGETGTWADRWLLFSHKVKAPSLRTFIFKTSVPRQSTQIQLNLWVFLFSKLLLGQNNLLSTH